MRIRPALLVLLLSFPLFGETIEISIVNCNVVVTDEHGHRVRGLTPSDFEIREDGAPQAITNFAEYTAQSPQREKKTIVLFIDRYPDARFRVEASYNALKKTLHEIVAPGDAVLIATWRGYPTVMLEPTDDLAAIDATLDNIAAENIVAPFFRYNRPMILEPGVYRTDTGIGWGMSEEWFATRIQSRQIRNEIAAINSLINAMADEGGRKALILMTHSVAPVRGTDYYYAIDRDVSRWHGYYRASAFDSVKATAVAQNVTVYAFPPGIPLLSSGDPFSTEMPGAAVSRELDRLSAMTDIANSTGGAYATGTDIVRALPRMRDDVSDYYSMAYREPARNDNRLRKVTVTTKNPAYTVRTRREYIEKNDDTRMRDELIASFLLTPAPSSISVDANLGAPVKQAKRRYTLPVTVRWPATPFTTAVSLYFATGSAAGEASPISKRTVTLDPARFKEVKDGSIEYDFDLVADTSADRLSIAVYDETTHESGVARVDLPRMQ